MKALPLILELRPVPRYTRYGGIDAFNAMEQLRKRDLSLEEVKLDFEATHARLMDYLWGVPSRAFDMNGFSRRLRQDTCNHYREHASQILAWRVRHGL